VTAFESAAIPAGLMQAVKAAQEALEQPERAFDFLKSVEQSRLDQEAIIKRKVQAVFAKYDGRFTDALLAGETDFPWDEFSAELTRALGVEISAAMAEEVMRQAEALHVGIEPGLVNAAAIDWARSYTYDLVKELRGTTEKGVTAAQAQIQATLQQSVGQFLETPKMTRADLEKLLAPTFGEARASMIAVTEVTRAASAATTHYQEYLGEHGLQMERVWHTRNDELVCPICGPLNGQPESVWAADFPDGPPSHVNCRCAVGLRAVPEESKSNA
jgi:SPP1 gp7 family putative phage head morphogenesis protein